MKRNRSRINMPGSKGYNPRRGSGKSFRNVARTAGRAGHPIVYHFK